MRNFLCFFLLILSGFSWGTARSEDLPIVQNLPTLEAVDQYTDVLIQRWREEQNLGKPASPWVFLHLGSAIPPSLEWVFDRLKAAGVPFQSRLISEAELERQIESSVASIERIHYDPKQSSTLAPKPASIKKKAGLFLRRIFRLPHGITFSFHMNRSLKEILTEAGIAAGVAGASSVSQYMILHEAQLNRPDINVVRTVAFIAAHVWLMCYFRREVGAFSVQQNLTKIRPDGKVELEPRYGFVYLTGVGLAFISNAIVQGGMLGFSGLLERGFLQNNLLNVLTYVFGRAWIDRLISMRIPHSGPDGEHPTEGVRHWPLWKYLVVSYGFESAIQLMASLNFVGLGGNSDVLFYGLGLAGFAHMFFGNISLFRDNVIKPLARREGSGVACETILISPHSTSPAVP